MSLTPTLAESAVRLGTWLPFAQAAKQLAHFVHTQLSEATLTRLTERAGAAYAAVQDAQAAQVRADPGPLMAGPPLQQVSVDGAFVPLVHKGWVEAKSLAIGTVQPPVRLADGRVEVHTTHLSYFSRVADCHTFTDLATGEIVRRGTLTAGRVCGVVDGALWEQDFLAVHCPGAVHILDWPHAVGYLANVAHALSGVDTPASAAWLAAQRETLLHGDPQRVLAKLRGLAEELTLQAGEGPPPPALAVLDETLTYLTARLAQIQYAAFRARGYPIGSGAVESANKLVVEFRLKGAGMHWALAHVNPLLALRGMACSDRWEEAWPQLARQWRAEARSQVLEQRRRRQATQQAARDDAAGAANPADPVADAPPSGARPTPAAPASVLDRPRTPPRRSSRPAPNHPWRAALQTRRAAPAPPPAI